MSSMRPRIVGLWRAHLRRLDSFCLGGVVEGAFVACLGCAGGTPSPTPADVAEGLKETTCGANGSQVCLEGESNWCNWGGLCTLVANAELGCVCTAATDADCVRSITCHQTGRCWARAGQCVALPKPKCEESDIACPVVGRCSEVDGVCIAATDLDCRPSLECAMYGMCSSCLQHGVYTNSVGSVPNGWCIATSSSDCAASAECKIKGRCTLNVKNHVCAVGSDADCAASENCKLAGACTKLVMICVPISAADCLKSEQCKVAGKCKFDAELHLCTP